MANSIRTTKRDFWIINASVTVSHKVSFGEPVTPNEAKERFMSGDYEDIVDEEVQGINFVTSVGV